MFFDLRLQSLAHCIRKPTFSLLYFLFFLLLLLFLSPPSVLLPSLLNNLSSIPWFTILLQNRSAHHSPAQCQGLSEGIDDNYIKTQKRKHFFFWWTFSLHTLVIGLGVEFIMCEAACEGWSHMYDPQRVCCRLPVGKPRQVFPAQLHSSVHGPSKGFKASEPTSSAGQGKAHLLRLCSIKEKMWWPFTFFYWKKKWGKKKIPWGTRGGGRFASVLILWLMSKGLTI